MQTEDGIREQWEQRIRETAAGGDPLATWVEYIRWQLTTFVGTGFSAQAHVSGDIDGIFGGSPHTYVRDLQFKCLMTTMMSMSGW